MTPISLRRRHGTRAAASPNHRRTTRAAVRLLGAASAAAALAAGAALLLLARPSLLVNERSAAFILGRAHAYAPRWAALSVSARALGGTRHRYEFKISDLCISKRDGTLDACFESIEASALVDWSRRGPVLVALERLRATGRHLRLTAGLQPSPLIQATFRTWLERAAAGRLLPSRLTSARIEDCDVRLPLFQLVRPTSTVTGALSVRLAPNRALPLQILMDARVRTSRGARRLRLQAEAGSDLFTETPPRIAEARAAGSYDGKTFRAAARIRRENHGAGTLRVSASAGAYRIDGRWQAAPGQGHWALSGGLRARSGAGLLTLTDCRGTAMRRVGKLLPPAANLTCRWEARAPVLESARLGHPPSLAGALRLAARIEGKPGKTATISHELDATAAIPRFEKLVTALSGTRWAIPAPLHVLKGTLSATASSHGNSRSPVQRMRWSASADLASVKQRLLARATGTLSAAGLGAAQIVLNNDAELIISDMVLELPSVDVSGIPQFAVDRRIIHETHDNRAARRKFSTRARISMRTERPLRLLSNLAKEPVPIGLDLTVTSPPTLTSGTVAIRSFGIELFRRAAIVDHLNLALIAGEKAARLEGVVLYRAAEATIRIILMGTTRRPQIEFESDPPMDRDQIIALLVYGKSPGELDLDQAQSVGNTRTALESKAFGLLSLYLFGTTPIETVTYDSATRSYAVKLRLPGGASMELSSDFSQTRELRLRKLLAPHWAVQSEFKSVRDQGGGGAAWLEWFNRY